MSVEWWSIVISALVAVGLAILGWFERQRSKEHDQLAKRVDGMEETQKEHGESLATLKEAMKHLPTSESIGRLHDKINAVALVTAELKGAQQTTNDLLGRLVQLREEDAPPRPPRR